MSKKFKLVFMGTPDFALPTLKRLHETEHTISLVVTQPDRPKGRGRKITAPPVKRVANELGYAILQPVSIKTDAFAQKLGKLKPDFLIVVSYVHMLVVVLLKKTSLQENFSPQLNELFRS